MTLEELKKIIESGKVPEQLVILKYSDSGFIPYQYITFIRKNKEYQVEFHDNLNGLINNTIDIFSFENNEKIYKIVDIETFDSIDESLRSLKNVLVVCKKVIKESAKIFSDFIVEVPKLENWQIEDYVYSVADGVDQKLLKRLIEVCNSNIYRLHQEVEKLSIFPKEQRKYLYQDFLDDGAFSDLSNLNIFNFSTCIVKRDIKGLFEVYKELQNIDIEPIGLLILLVQNFRDIISVQLSPNSSAESLGMKPNKYWAVKYSCGFYTKEELMFIYSFLCSLDAKIKIGEMPMEHLIDYIIIKVMGLR